MIQKETKVHIQTKTKLVIDVVLLMAFLITMDPESSGIAVHEWLSTALLAVVTIHLLLSWDWIVQVTRRFTGKVNATSRINYLLNWLLFIDGALMMLSGFMISESLLPFLGIGLPHNFAWRSLHDLSANLFLVLVGLHTALHWSWIVDALQRCVFRPVGRVLSSRSRKDMAA